MARSEMIKELKEKEMSVNAQRIAEIEIIDNRKNKRKTRI